MSRKPKTEEVTNKQFGFSEALSHLQNNQKVFREGWNGKGLYVGLQPYTNSSDMTLPYLYMSTVYGDLVPWTPSQTDLLAEDWEVKYPPPGIHPPEELEV